MSDFTNVTGFAPPTSLSGSMGLPETAFFRGLPFKVIAARVKKAAAGPSTNIPTSTAAGPRTWAVRSAPGHSPAT
jgi:hypothetical protein